MSSKKLPVFNDLKGWFSASVPRKTKELWKKHGGKEVSSAKDANFIFSNDASDPDTTKLFESDEFLRGFLTVFHTDYIDACLQEKTAQEVPAAGYILLPSDMADDVMMLAYVCSESIPPRAASVTAKKPVQNTTSQPSEKNRQSKTIQQNKTSQPSKPSQPVNENTNQSHNQERLSSNPQSQSQSRDCPLGSFAHAEDALFRIDDLASVPFVKSMPRFGGELVDFVPGVNGCSLTLKAS